VAAEQGSSALHEPTNHVFESQESDYRESDIDKGGPIEGAELASARRVADRARVQAGVDLAVFVALKPE